jgi:exopolysaccharide biosynthesis protein
VKDGKMGKLKTTHQIFGSNPRSGFGMVKKGHYIGIVVDGGETTRRGGVRLDDFAQLFLDRNCIVAYNFDGGQSACMVFMGNSITNAAKSPKRLEPGKNWGGQRKITDIFRIGESPFVPVKAE